LIIYFVLAGDGLAAALVSLATFSMFFTFFTPSTAFAVSVALFF
jgi:hypothetical protein